MTGFRCENCTYVYRHEVGDATSDTPPGTAFDDLKKDWRCPVCRAGKDSFSPTQTEHAGTSQGAVREYSRPGLTVLWQSALCNHNGNCTRSLPEVFDMERRPWVDIMGANLGAIVAVVKACPTGALSIKEHDAEA